MLNQQAAADKEARRLVRLAYQNGGTVPFSLGRLIDLKISTKIIRAVYRGAQ
jgi:ribosomal protein L28